MRSETREVTDNPNISPFTRMQIIGYFALYKKNYRKSDIAAFMTDQVVRYLAVYDTVTINPAEPEGPDKQLTIHT